MRKDVDFFLFSPTSLVPWHFFTLTCDGFRQNRYLWVQQMRMDREWSRPRNLKTTTADHAEVLPWFQGYYLLQLPREMDGLSLFSWYQATETLVCKTVASRMNDDVCFLPLLHNFYHPFRVLYNVSGVCGYLKPSVTQYSELTFFDYWIRSLLTFWGKCCPSLRLFFLAPTFCFLLPSSFTSALTLDLWNTLISKNSS